MSQILRIVAVVSVILALADGQGCPAGSTRTITRRRVCNEDGCRIFRRITCRSGGRCPEGTRWITIRRRTCSCRPVESVGPSSKGSLIFVIDDTGSMGSVIDSVRSNINAILAANKIFTNYVISTYGDPYVKNVLKTTNVDEVREFLAKVYPHGGGDCPEFAFSGVRDAAAAADENSVLFLFTDASAKDGELQDTVASELNAKKIRFITVATGNLCSTPGSEYEAVASKTGGRLANIGAASTTAVMEFITKAVAGDMSFGAFPSSAEDLTKALAGDCGCRVATSYWCA